MAKILTNTYDAASLRRELDDFERRYERTSEEHFTQRYSADGATGISGFDSHVWADTYREWKRLASNA